MVGIVWLLMAREQATHKQGCTIIYGLPGLPLPPPCAGSGIIAGWAQPASSFHPWHCDHCRPRPAQPRHAYRKPGASGELGCQILWRWAVVFRGPKLPQLWECFQLQHTPSELQGSSPGRESTKAPEENILLWGQKGSPASYWTPCFLWKFPKEINLRDTKDRKTRVGRKLSATENKAS